MHPETIKPTSDDNLRSRHLRTAEFYRKEAAAIESQWWATKARPSWTHEQNERKWSQSPEARKARDRITWAAKYEGYAQAIAEAADEKAQAARRK